MKNIRHEWAVITASVLSLSAPASAYAYIGPGSGLSAIGSLLALLATATVVVFGFIWYPLKRLMRKRKKANGVQAADAKNDEPKE